MIFLPDVNVWIALTSDRHVHHRIAARLFQRIGADDRLVFCRITELGLLRLLTNAHVMGEDALTPQAAWQAYDQWRSDSRVAFLSEMREFHSLWDRLGRQVAGGANAWTDAYLSVFAEHVDARIITFDRHMRSLGAAAIDILL